MFLFHKIGIAVVKDTIWLGGELRTALHVVVEINQCIVSYDTAPSKILINTIPSD